MRRPIRVLTAAVVALVLVVAAGCAKKPVEAKLVPKVKPPAVAKAGLLTVGVDLQTPPFAGEDQGQKAGIDIDVAAALAEKLGLNVRYVDVAPSEAATAVAEGKVDVALSVPIATADLTRLSIAGTYFTDGPGIFLPASQVASGAAETTLDTLSATPIAAQTGSEAFWMIRDERGEESIAAKDSLRQALEAVANGEAPAAAGDVAVGVYLLKDLPKVAYAGQLGDASPLGIATAVDNATLSDAVRTALDELAADGVLDSIQKKWLGGLPKLKVKEAKAAGEATVTP